MSKLSDIDKNFKVGSLINKTDVDFFNIEDKRFNIYGVFKEDGKYLRIPQAVADTVSDGVKLLCKHTAGGRVCFKTNSPYLAISAKYNNVLKMGNLTMSACCGFDVYFKEGKKQKYEAAFFPFPETVDSFEGVVEFGEAKEREIILNLPLYSGIDELYIGLKSNSTLAPLNPYDNDKKVVFYGSSITHGACASRPGNSYEAMLSRKFSFDYINLGFSGSALGEDTIADYIANLQMDVFVYDYDHNAQTAEYLKKTHEKMFKKIRAKHPNIPVVFMTRPNQTKPFAENFKVVLETYENAKAAGDKNVYFVSGQEIFNMCDADACTVDGCHPNDLGFYCMTECVGKVLKEIL